MLGKLKYLNECVVGRFRALLLFPDFPHNLVTSGSEDSTVKLWSLPESGMTEGSMGVDDAFADLTFSYSSIRRVDPTPSP